MGESLDVEEKEGGGKRKCCLELQQDVEEAAEVAKQNAILVQELNLA